MKDASPRVQLLEQMYIAFSKAVYWAAYQKLNDRELAGDVMQNVFLNAYRHMDKLTDMSEDQRRAWLYRSAVNGSIDMLRRGKRTVITEDAGKNEPDSALSPDEEAEKSETRAAVRKALSGLPEKYKEPLTLYYFAEMDYKQISALLNINEGTLKSRMSRGRAMMEKALNKDFMKGGGLNV